MGIQKSLSTASEHSRWNSANSSEMESMIAKVLGQLPAVPDTRAFQTISQPKRMNDVGQGAKLPTNRPSQRVKHSC